MKPQQLPDREAVTWRDRDYQVVRDGVTTRAYDEEGEIAVILTGSFSALTVHEVLGMCHAAHEVGYQVGRDRLQRELRKLLGAAEVPS